MKKNYKMRLFGLAVCLLLGLFAVSCNKDEITEEQVRIVLGNAKLVEDAVTPFFMSSENAEEMALHLDEIRKMEHVEDAWQDDNTIAIKIKDGGIIRWCFFPTGGSDEKVGELLDIIKVIETKDINNTVCENKNVCIAITTPFDESRASFRLANGSESGYYRSWKDIKNAFEQKGYIVCPKDEEDEYEFYYGGVITPEFYCDLLPEFGVNIIITHGNYLNGIHWIMTGKEESYFSSQLYYTPWDKDNLEPWVIKEVRNGDIVEKKYYAINQNYLSNNMKERFSNNSVMFMWACKTMMDNYEFSNFFREKGLGCYFGYDDLTYRDRAGKDLAWIMQYMIFDGLTAGEAYYKLGRGSNPHLLLNPENSDIILVENSGPDEGDWVDLGLPSGLLWATRNVGASSPEDYGDYFAWGETSPKSFYSESTYIYCNGDLDQLIKYCSNSGFGYNGFTDNLTILQPGDDAATANYGGRTPTYLEWQELINNTTSQMTTQNGVYGLRFTGSNGNSLFLPAAGYRWDSTLYGDGRYGYYWSSSLKTDYPRSAWSFYIEGNQGMGYDGRYDGLSVRAVRSAR